MTYGKYFTWNHNHTGDMRKGKKCEQRRQFQTGPGFIYKWKSKKNQEFVLCENIIVFGISMCFPVSNCPLCHKLCTVSVYWCRSKTFQPLSNGESDSQSLTSQCHHFADDSSKGRMGHSWTHANIGTECKQKWPPFRIISRESRSCIYPTSALPWWLWVCCYWFKSKISRHL